MSQNITLMGASYSAVPAVELPLTGGGTARFTDTSDATATASNVLSGYTAYGAAGTKITGTATGGGASQTLYAGTSTPSSGTGSDGDVYVVLTGSGTVEAYPASFTSSNMNSTSNASKCIGVSAEDGDATGNVYSSGNSTTGVIEYSFDLSGIPSGAAINSVSCDVMAHEENSSRSTFTLQLYAGSTAKGSRTTVSGTSNTTYSLTCGSWTRSELDSLVLHTEYGYYGGLVAGATVSVSYALDTPAADTTLTITASGWTLSGDLYVKSSGTWATAASAALDSSVAHG